MKKDNPKAYRSPLWPHVEQIRSWRRGRATWDEIRQKLLDEFKIEISIQGVEAFFKRSSKVENPKGFEIERPQPPEKPQPVTPPAVRTSDEQARKETKTEAYQRALKESQQKPTTLFNEEQLN